MKAMKAAATKGALAMGAKAMKAMKAMKATKAVKAMKTQKAKTSKGANDFVSETAFYRGVLTGLIRAGRHDLASNMDPAEAVDPMIWQ